MEGCATVQGRTLIGEFVFLGLNEVENDASSPELAGDCRKRGPEPRPGNSGSSQCHPRSPREVGARGDHPRVKEKINDLIKSDARLRIRSGLE